MSKISVEVSISGADAEQLREYAKNHNMTVAEAVASCAVSGVKRKAALKAYQDKTSGGSKKTKAPKKAAKAAKTKASKPAKKAAKAKPSKAVSGKREKTGAKKKSGAKKATEQKSTPSVFDEQPASTGTEG